MSTWTADDVDLPSSITELATALEVPNFSQFVLASAPPQPQDSESASARALTLERLLGARRRSPSPEQLPVTRSGITRTRSRALLGMSWPNDGIERRRRDRDRPTDDEAPWTNAVEMARRAGYPAAEESGQASGDARDARSRPGSRQETSSTARAIRERVRLERGGRAPLSLGPQGVVPAAYSWANYHGSDGERNQRMATTLLRRRRTDEERRRDENDANPTSASTRRERAIDGGTSRTHITYGFDPTDIEPPGGADDHIWERLAALSSDEDEDGWGAFRGAAPIGDFPGPQAMLFDLFDVDGWGAAPDVGASLSRGRFNRRRQSMRGREGEIPIDLARERPGVRARDGSESDASIEYASTPVKRRRRDGAPEAPQPTVDASRPSYVAFSTLPASADLPTTFQTPQRSSELSLTSFLNLTVEERKGVPRPIVTFRPRGKDLLTRDDADACSLHASLPIPRGIGLHYFEIEVLNSGKHGHISVGWTKADCHPRRLVGWDTGSWGWHADDGKTFEGSGEGRNFSEPWNSESPDRELREG